MSLSPSTAQIFFIFFIISSTQMKTQWIRKNSLFTWKLEQKIVLANWKTRMKMPKTKRENTRKLKGNSTIKWFLWLGLLALLFRFFFGAQSLLIFGSKPKKKPSETIEFLSFCGFQLLNHEPYHYFISRLSQSHSKNEITKRAFILFSKFNFAPGRMINIFVSFERIRDFASN